MTGTDEIILPSEQDAPECSRLGPLFPCTGDCQYVLPRDACLYDVALAGDAP